MLRTLPTRRRPRYGAQVCAVIAALLLLLSVSILHSRLKFNPNSHHQFQNLEFTQDPIDDLDAIVANPLLEDVENDGLANNVSGDDLIDELDVVEEEQSKVSDEEEILRGLEDDSESSDGLGLKTPKIGNKRSGYYWDHVVGARRRSFDKQLIDPWEDLSNFGYEDRSRVAFASDDQPLNEDVRSKFDLIRGIEDALLLKIGKHNSPLREGWASWFEKKGDFLRRDRMFRPNLELLNPANNPLLQDPDGVGSTSLTRGDKLMQKSFLSEVGMKHSRVVVTNNQVLDMRRGMMEGSDNREVDVRNGNDVTRLERRTLDNDDGSVHNKNLDTSSDTSESTPSNKADRHTHDSVHNKNIDTSSDTSESIPTNKAVDPSTLKIGQQIDKHKLDTEKQIKSELSDHIYADGKRWGYFPGLSPQLSFSEFMDEFFAKGKCSMRAFMVWNSSPWMYTVRHQRSLESLLYHNPDACVVVFSETVELDFFKDFVKDGYKVAVAMPNLDELLKDTPAHVFASVWFEWRKTKFYPVHYSELVRLASLYRYGGLYLDSDMIVLKPLSSLNNSIATEDESAKSSLNGAVMLFRKNSPFILECLREFYSTYDDTLLRWNGADLLTRTAKKFLTPEKSFDEQLELKIQPSSMFFPIRSQDIPRYFKAPANEIERTQQYILLQKILEGSYTFHFWNNLTSSLVPEPESLAAKLLNHGCIRCNDVL